MKRKNDIEKAHEDRIRDISYLQKLFNGSGLHIRKAGDPTYYYPPTLRKILNKLINRYTKTEGVQKQFGHHAIIWHEKNQDDARFIEIRYSDRGFYWKAPVKDDSGISILKALNPLFFVLHVNTSGQLLHLAVLDFDNLYMKRGWQKYKSKTNLNRWTNSRIEKSLKDTFGFTLPNNSTELISCLNNCLSITK